jgi:RNA polymerase sigma factor (TIGR02999 family)
MSDVTRILAAIEEGDSQAVDKLLPAVYQELRQLAAQKLSQERPGQTLQATALVHEAYLRLVGADNQTWKSRTHFFAAAAEAMRRILIENARRKRRLKRGGGQLKVGMDEAIAFIDSPSEDVIAIDEALARLAEEESTIAELVKLRFFGGLTLEQAGEVLGISRRTATRHWTFARAWLYKQLAQDDSHDSQ